MGLFNFLTIFDWMSSLAETVKDIEYTSRTGQLGCPISGSNPYETKEKLEKGGETVISVTTSLGGKGFVDVPGSEVSKALAVLGYSTLEG